MTERKVFPALVKSVDTKQGLVTSVVAVFGNVDAVRDRIIPGAFAKSIEKWKSRMTQGKYLPVVYGHRDDPSFILGKVVDLRETAEGLEVDEQFFMNKGKASDAVDMMGQGVLDGSSFAYDIIRAKNAEGGVLDLIELDLIEVGPTIYPANDETRLVAVKSRGTKAFLYLDGSMEDLQNDLREAVQAWTLEGGISGWAWVEATFTDRVVFGVETYALGTWEDRYYEAAYTLGEGGAPVLGEVAEVELSATAVTVAKSRAAWKGLARAKPRRAPNRSPEGKTDEPVTAKVDDPPVRAALKQALAEADAVSDAPASG